MKGASKSQRRVVAAARLYDQVFASLDRIPRHLSEERGIGVSSLADLISRALGPLIPGDSSLSRTELQNVRKLLNRCADMYRQFSNAPMVSDVDRRLKRIHSGAEKLHGLLSGLDSKDATERWVYARLSACLDELGEVEGNVEAVRDSLNRVSIAASMAAENKKTAWIDGHPGRYTKHILELLMGLDAIIFVPRGLRRTYSDNGSAEPEAPLTDATYAIAMLLPRDMRPASRRAVFATHRQHRKLISSASRGPG